MADIIHGAKIGVSGGTAEAGICLEFSDKQQYTTALFPVVDVSLSGGRGFGCRALALPVEQALVDGIIVVHGGGRVILVSLVQGHKEHIQLLFRQPLHTLTDGRRLQEIQCHQQLVAGVGAMQVERTVETYVHWLVNEINVVVLVLQKRLQFVQQHWAVRKRI